MLKGLVYDERVLNELRRIYGNPKPLLLSLKHPGRHVCLRVNVLKASPEEVLEEIGGYVPYREMPEVVCARIEGPFKVEMHEKVVVADKYAAESVMLGANLYAPGVIRAKGVKKGDRVTVVVERTFEPVAEGVAMMDEEEMKGGRGLAVLTERSLYKAPKTRELKSVKEGKAYEQSAPSAYVAHVVDPKEGELIVDMNAAPGGKASHVYEISGGKAKVIAVDLSKKRVRKMMENFKRLGHDIEVVRADSRYLDVDYPSLVGKVDAVLIDPPCTALGVIPKLWDVKTGKDIENAVRYQRQFFKPASKLLKRGGRLVYSTCTLTWSENEGMIEYAERYGFELEEIRGPWGRCREGTIRVSPHLHMEPGFYIMKFRKI